MARVVISVQPGGVLPGLGSQTLLTHQGRTTVEALAQTVLAVLAARGIGHDEFRRACGWAESLPPHTGVAPSPTGRDGASSLPPHTGVALRSEAGRSGPAGSPAAAAEAARQSLASFGQAWGSQGTSNDVYARPVEDVDLPTKEPNDPE